MQVVLANIGDGVMDEKFEKAVKEVTANIQDPNTPAQAKRTISITIDFVPDETREQASVAIEVKTKLAGQKRKLSVVHFVIDHQTARHKAVTAAFHQRELFEAKDAKDERERASNPDPTNPGA